MELVDRWEAFIGGMATKCIMGYRASWTDIRIEYRDSKR